ncbi:MAG: RNase adapter RapZ [Stagnimonas sp.]|nr:RNase adapter RapZ [Stagnimonas sp.]
MSEAPARMKLTIVSGLSGAGKSVALRQYEDLGWFCIDNIPLGLIEPLLVYALRSGDARYNRVAIGVDARAAPSEIEGFSRSIEELRLRDIDTDVLFLQCDDQILLKRYTETRRKHPLSDGETSLVDALQRERELLKPVSHAADLILDTSAFNLHQLREAIHQRLPEGRNGRMSVLFLSFGFKNGAPDGADFLFDARCLPNPHWELALRPLTGRDGAVARWLERHTDVINFQRDIRLFLESWLPRFQDQDRAYVTVAIGCTGGQHRSVYLIEMLGRFFRERFDQVIVKHRDLN